MILYTRDHEWVLLEDLVVTVGITHYAQFQLGDVVFVELPEVGRKVIRGEEVAVIESVKAASDVYAPLEGEITEVNDELVSQPNLVNENPEGNGWFFKMKLNSPVDTTHLLDKEAYASYSAEE